MATKAKNTTEPEYWYAVESFGDPVNARLEICDTIDHAINLIDDYELLNETQYVYRIERLGILEVKRKLTYNIKQETNGE